MQLQRIRIGAFRNLQDLEIRFAPHLGPSSGSAPDAPPESIRSHALIGQKKNGTGKSNLIEALVTIFRDVDLDRDADLDYELDYTIGGHAVRIKAIVDEQKRPYVWVDGKAESQGYLLRNRELLPSHVFAYYSGRNERMEELFRVHEHRFTRRMESTDEEGLPAHLLENFTGSDADIAAIAAQRRRQDSKTLRQFGDDRLRRLFYCRGGHSQLVLLACLLSDDPVFRKVLDKLNIVALESALFVLKQPHHLRDLKEDDILQGNPRFWYARGSLVSEFLDKLWQVAWAPIQHEESRVVDFRGRREVQKQLFLYVPSQEKLEELGGAVGPASSFFRYAEGAYIDGLDEHPQGMGVAGLLKSDMFGLASTVDLPTLAKLDRRNELIAKSANAQLPGDEELELERLRAQLDDLGFSREQRDPMFQLFIQKMAEVRARPPTSLLTPHELAAQEQLATAIVAELVKRERVDDLSNLARELKLQLGGT